MIFQQYATLKCYIFTVWISKGTSVDFVKVKFLKLKFHRSLHRLVRLLFIMWRLLTCVLMASGLQARDLRTRQTTCPKCVRPVPLLICSRVLLFRRGEGQMWLLHGVCGGREGVLWGSRTCGLRSDNDLWISQQRARACVRVWLPWASVRQRWENISLCLSIESGEQTDWDERHPCCHFFIQRGPCETGEGRITVCVGVHNNWPTEVNNNLNGQT